MYLYKIKIYYNINQKICNGEKEIKERITDIKMTYEHFQTNARQLRATRTISTCVCGKCLYCSESISHGLGKRENMNSKYIIDLPGLFS